MNKVYETAQAYRDYMNYWDCIEWPTWMKQMYFAVKFERPDVISSYLPHIRNAYILLKP